MNIEQRVKLMIGDLVVANTTLTAQLEQAREEIAALKAKPPPQESTTPKSAVT